MIMNLSEHSLRSTQNFIQHIFFVTSKSKPSDVESNIRANYQILSVFIKNCIQQFRIIKKMFINIKFSSFYLEIHRSLHFIEFSSSVSQKKKLIQTFQINFFRICIHKYFKNKNYKFKQTSIHTSKMANFIRILD